MAVQDTLVGSVFDDRYRIVRKLGAGGMADVYLAEDQELGRRVAIKILNDRHAADAQFIERFRREAKNAAGLSHPNIVSIYDRGEAEGTYYIAMEYLDGRSLKELLVTRGPTPIKIAIDYARQILAAMGFAHRNGIVHRDIKPHNVVVGGEGRLKVTDFGIARSGASQMTEVGSIIGTAQYLSPEQARGAPVDQRSDLYSLGIVLYEMLTGHVPFTGETPLEIAMKHLSSVPKPPSELRPEVPHDLDMVVLRALAKDPDERYQSAEEMSADLGRVARGLSVSTETADAATAVLAGSGITSSPTVVAPPPTVPVTRPPGGRPPAAYYGYEGPPPRRRPFWPWLVALLLVIAAGAAAWFAYQKIQDQLSASKPVAVPYLIDMQESLAVNKVRDAHLKPVVERHENAEFAKGHVYNQSPDAGQRIPKNDQVRIFVSSGKPKVSVPNVVGQARDDAISTLAAQHLKAHAVDIFSTKPVGTVIAQDPRPGERVFWNTRVRINVSKGAAPISVPPVVGLNVDLAASQLEGSGFKVQRQYVESGDPKDTVVGQDPTGNTPATRGSTVTLRVSKGPKTANVPSVTGEDQQTATDDLHSAGFKVAVTKQSTTDPTQDGLVISQSPSGGSPAPKGSTVTIVVGVFQGP